MSRSHLSLANLKGGFRLPATVQYCQYTIIQWRKKLFSWSCRNCIRSSRFVRTRLGKVPPRKQSSPKYLRTRLTPREVSLSSMASEIISNGLSGIRLRMEYPLLKRVGRLWNPPRADPCRRLFSYLRWVARVTFLVGEQAKCQCGMTGTLELCAQNSNRRFSKHSLRGET